MDSFIYKLSNLHGGFMRMGYIRIWDYNFSNFPNIPLNSPAIRQPQLCETTEIFFTKIMVDTMLINVSMLNIREKHFFIYLCLQFILICFKRNKNHINKKYIDPEDITDFSCLRGINTELK